MYLTKVIEKEKPGHTKGMIDNLEVICNLPLFNTCVTTAKFG